MAERLLIIEDDAALAQLVHDYLAPLGFDVTIVGTATEGLRRVEGESFDAVLLDIMLPDLDGFEVCQQLRGANELTPILMLTAYSDRRNLLELSRLADEVFAESDVLSLHAPALPSTHHIVDARSLARMKPGSYLVNCARGPLVDHEALLAINGVGRHKLEKYGSHFLDAIAGHCA